MFKKRYRLAVLEYKGCTEVIIECKAWWWFMWEVIDKGIIVGTEEEISRKLEQLISDLEGT